MENIQLRVQDERCQEAQLDAQIECPFGCLPDLENQLDLVLRLRHQLQADPKSETTHQAYNNNQNKKKDILRDL